MQAGFEAASYLGTPLAEPLPSPAAAVVRSGLSQQIFQNSLQFPDMSVSERNIVFRKQPPMLQGMNLSRVPTGGFPSTPASVIVGAGVDGVEYNTRMPALFSQPGDPGRRVEIAPTTPLTGENGGETVYRTAAPDGATRQKRGAMTVRRAEQEAAIARKKQRNSLAKMLDVLPPGMPLDRPSLPAAAPATPKFSSKPLGIQAMAQPFAASSPPASVATAVLAERGTDENCGDVTMVARAENDTKMTRADFFVALQNRARKLHESTRHLVTGKVTWETYARRFINEQYWIVMGVAATAMIVLVILVIVVIIAVRQTTMQSSRVVSETLPPTTLA